LSDTTDELILRRTTDDDVLWAANTVRWHDRDTASPQEWHQRLHAEAAAHAVIDIPSLKFRYLFYVVSQNWTNGTAYLLVHCPDEQLEHPATTEATKAFVAWFFSVWPIRRLYLEWLDLVPIPAGLHDLAEIEGRLLEHRFVGGSYRDIVIFAFTEADR